MANKTKLELERKELKAQKEAEKKNLREIQEAYRVSIIRLASLSIAIQAKETSIRTEKQIKEKEDAEKEN